MHPAALIGQAVLAQGAAPLRHAPATLEARVGLEAQPAALPQRRALVQVGCNGRSRAGSARAPQPMPKVLGGKRHLLLPPSHQLPVGQTPTGRRQQHPGLNAKGVSQSFLDKASCLETQKPGGQSQGGLEAEGALSQVLSHPSLTLDVLGVVNDKVPIPDHRQVDGQVTDVIPFVEILQEETERRQSRLIVEAKCPGEGHRKTYNPVTWMSPITPEERDGILAGTCWLGTNRSDSHSSKHQSQHMKPVGWTDKKR